MLSIILGIGIIAGGIFAIIYIAGIADDYKYFNQDVNRFIDRF